MFDDGEQREQRAAFWRAYAQVLSMSWSAMLQFSFCPIKGKNTLFTYTASFLLNLLLIALYL